MGAVATALCCSTTGFAQTVRLVDSTHADSQPTVVTRAAPPAWVTRGDGVWLAVAAVASIGIAPLDKPITNEFGEPHWARSRQVHHIAGDVAFLGGDGPFVVSSIVAAAGYAVGPAWLQRFALHNTEAIALATIVNGFGKGIAGRALPGVQTKHSFEVGRGFHDGNGPFVSFPSGHTAAAFAMAATIHGEVLRADSTRGRIVGDIAFAAAAAVGVARVAQRVHWLSDLPVGAVIGTWSGRVVQEHVRDSSRAASMLRGLVIGRDGRRVRIGWRLLARDALRAER